MGLVVLGAILSQQPDRILYVDLLPSHRTNLISALAKKHQRSNKRSVRVIEAEGGFPECRQLRITQVAVARAWPLWQRHAVHRGMVQFAALARPVEKPPESRAGVLGDARTGLQFVEQRRHVAFADGGEGS